MSWNKFRIVCKTTTTVEVEPSQNPHDNPLRNLQVGEPFLLSLPPLPGCFGAEAHPQATPPCSPGHAHPECPAREGRGRGGGGGAGNDATCYMRESMLRAGPAREGEAGQGKAEQETEPSGSDGRTVATLPGGLSPMTLSCASTSTPALPLHPSAHQSLQMMPPCYSPAHTWMSFIVCSTMSMSMLRGARSISVCVMSRTILYVVNMTTTAKMKVQMGSAISQRSSSCGRAGGRGARSMQARKPSFTAAF